MTAIPPNIYQRIREWVDAQLTGKVVLNVHDGRIETAEFTERVKAEPKP